MLPQDNAIRTYFVKLGFEPEIADIYLSLSTNGSQTISELSRSSKVERTRIYRLIDRLMESSLIEIEPGHKRGMIKAAPIANVKIFITQKEQELQSLRDDLELVETALSRNSLSSPTMKIQIYNGAEGIRQMQWNQTRAKSNILSILCRPINSVVGDKFLRTRAESINNNNQSIRVLHNSQYQKLTKEWSKNNTPELITNQENKILGSDVLNITYNTDTYDDTVAYYHWKDNEIYGTEIHNQLIADTQRTMFETLWNS